MDPLLFSLLKDLDKEIISWKSFLKQLKSKITKNYNNSLEENYKKYLNKKENKKRKPKKKSKRK